MPFIEWGDDGHLLASCIRRHIRPLYRIPGAWSGFLPHLVRILRQIEYCDHRFWVPPVKFRRVLVPVDLFWGELKQLCGELSDAEGFLQQPSGYATRNRMLLYNPQFFHMPGEILWEVQGGDPVDISTRN